MLFNVSKCEVMHIGRNQVILFYLFCLFYYMYKTSPQQTRDETMI